MKDWQKYLIAAIIVFIGYFIFSNDESKTPPPPPPPPPCQIRPVCQRNVEIAVEQLKEAGMGEQILDCIGLSTAFRNKLQRTINALKEYNDHLTSCAHPNCQALAREELPKLQPLIDELEDAKTATNWSDRIWKLLYSLLLFG